MTPKEKAKDLYVKFSDYCSWNTFEQEQDFINNIKQCAFIAVDELLGDIDDSILHPQNKEAIDYWQQVKQEIEKL